MIAALYVQTNGVYFGLDDVDPWDEHRDARLYNGPHPVVAHPPCARWGMYATGNPRFPGRYKIGDDDGCFEAALNAVRRWGGVIEHPAYSKAWAWFGINRPPYHGGWIAADWVGGWTCHVEQGHYGHLSRKATWLYMCGGGADLPELIWGPAEGKIRIDAGCKTVDDYRRRRRIGVVQLLSHRERAATPKLFRDLLLDIAWRVHR